MSAPLTIDQALAERLADAALATGTFAIEGGIVAVSDVMEVEGIANGQEPLPPAPTLVRADGRRVYFFALPEGATS